MKHILLLILFFYMQSTQAQSPFFKLNFEDNNHVNVEMSAYKGKKILIVNTASKCGYTPQYTALQKLYDLYKNKLVIIAFPCNQFAGQEPGNEEEIVQFCKKNYGVTFPIAAKIDVKGKNISPIYKWLTSKKENSVLDATITWNFNKFLIDENGQLLAYFPSNIDPLDESILKWLK